MPSINWQGFGANMANAAGGAQAFERRKVLEAREEEEYNFQKQAAEFKLSQAKQQAAQQQSQLEAAQAGAQWAMRNKGTPNDPNAVVEAGQQAAAVLGPVLGSGLKAAKGGVEKAAWQDYARYEQEKMAEAEALAGQMSEAAAGRFLDVVGRERTEERLTFDLTDLLNEIDTDFGRGLYGDDPSGVDQLKKLAEGLNLSDPNAAGALADIRQKALEAKRTRQAMGRNQSQVDQKLQVSQQYIAERARLDPSKYGPGTWGAMRHAEALDGLMLNADIRDQRDVEDAMKTYDMRKVEIDGDISKMDLLEMKAKGAHPRSHAAQQSTAELNAMKLVKRSDFGDNEYIYQSELKKARRLEYLKLGGDERLADIDPGQLTPEMEASMNQYDANRAGLAKALGPLSGKPREDVSDIHTMPKARRENILRAWVEMFDAGMSREQIDQRLAEMGGRLTKAPTPEEEKRARQQVFGGPDEKGRERPGHLKARKESEKGDARARKEKKREERDRKNALDLENGRIYGGGRPWEVNGR